eukprot:TRINITY_DN5035_c0_g1_i1.p1 TRINITY_DN5035_c0_g1~~TRINITY_DN5035_c0_g1_i1.p1  ORF type:complete len:368 (+),score=21.40 TRINITY_DN5035_c0_g1_i1:50-1153(+)
MRSVTRAGRILWRSSCPHAGKVARQRGGVYGCRRSISNSTKQRVGHSRCNGRWNGRRLRIYSINEGADRRRRRRARRYRSSQESENIWKRSEVLNYATEDFPLEQISLEMFEKLFFDQNLNTFMVAAYSCLRSENKKGPIATAETMEQVFRETIHNNSADERAVFQILDNYVLPAAKLSSRKAFFEEIAEVVNNATPDATRSIGVVLPNAFKIFIRLRELRVCYYDLVNACVADAARDAPELLRERVQKLQANMTARLLGCENEQQRAIFLALSERYLKTSFVNGYGGGSVKMSEKDYSDWFALLEKTETLWLNLPEETRKTNLDEAQRSVLSDIRADPTLAKVNGKKETPEVVHKFLSYMMATYQF